MRSDRSDMTWSHTTRVDDLLGTLGFAEERPHDEDSREAGRRPRPGFGPRADP